MPYFFVDAHLQHGKGKKNHAETGTPDTEIDPRTRQNRLHLRTCQPAQGEQ
ncbi:hypothetical protein P3W85_42230 [Cupriavidus basilensis]|uniref:Uncharacterized protein n=1 Tax=Cupriavidus basilensis TaxID=68895 RepID=A0ABT6B3P7_9BURK|nr:hypothetical protein [Cupriavidus basilensis]MDF3839511.1 hypothetical protein [Cupriavidus basilensis]